MIVEEEDDFEDVFVLMDYTLTLKPSNAKNYDYFEANVNWIIHNDYHFFDLGQILFE